VVLDCVISPLARRQVKGSASHHTVYGREGAWRLELEGSADSVTGRQAQQATAETIKFLHNIMPGRSMAFWRSARKRLASAPSTTMDRCIVPCILPNVYMCHPGVPL
jgi:hypothetical protein